MAFDLNSLAGKSAKVTVDFMGQSAVLTYDPSTLTAARVNTAQKGGDVGFTTSFTEIVSDWDVKRGNKKVPLTPDGLQGIPLPFLRACFMELMTTSADVSAEGNDSSGTSPQTETTVKRRTGTASSKKRST